MKEVRILKLRILSVVLALCLCISSKTVAFAWQEDPAFREDAKMAEALSPLAVQERTSPSPQEAYAAMIALKEQAPYQEGAAWTNETPYSDGNYYSWKGGMLDGKNIVAVGCVAFAFILSDAAFGSLQARMYAAGDFSFADIKAGDILRLNNDTHTVIVLEVSDVGVVVAEGNISSGDHQGKVHWGRSISKETVMADASHYITRYPDGYVAPDDPDANLTVAEGTLEGGLAWRLTKAGTLTVSGSGAMPDFGDATEQPWVQNSSRIRKVVIGGGVTRIGSRAFEGCGVLSAELPESLQTIGDSAFRGSSLISLTIPSGVTAIGGSAFQECQGLSAVTASEGLETIGPNAFQACTGLTSIALPASLVEVGDAAFFQCTELKSAVFAPGSRQVKLGANLFTQCYKLMGVTLPQKIDRISDGMFQNCLMMAGVEIPQGATSIGSNAFSSCAAFTTVLIPDSVTSIGIAAFASCPLKDIYFTGSEEAWNRISKIGDTASAVSRAVIHYNYVPPAPGPDDGDNPGDGSGSTGSGDDNPGGGSGSTDDGDHPGGGSGSTDDGDHPGGGSGSTGSGDDNPGGVQEGSGADTKTYHILEGTEGLWVANPDGSVTISADGELTDFVRLELDGRVVEPSDYTVRAGSTIVTLKPEFLKTLGRGNHTVTFVYKDGQVSMTLPYGGDGAVEKKTAPKTGAWGPSHAQAALLLAAAFLAVSLRRRGRN